MRQDERESLRLRFNFSCGYCGVNERDVGAELTVDHFQPRSKGGAEDPENWVYCCHACNEFKGDLWQPDSSRRILHPLADQLASHIEELEDGLFRGLTDVGAFHIERLRLNRPQLVAFRNKRRLLAKLQESQSLVLDRLEQIDVRVQKLAAKIADIESGGGNV